MTTGRKRSACGWFRLHGLVVGFDERGIWSELGVRWRCSHQHVAWLQRKVFVLRLGIEYVELGLEWVHGDRTCLEVRIERFLSLLGQEGRL